MEPCIDWEQAYERAGLWPVAVELPLGEVVYLLWYQTRNDFSRVVTSGGRVVVLTDLWTVATFVGDSEGFGDGDPGWEATRRLARIVGSETPDEKSIPRRLVGQSLEWLQKIPLCATADQTEELLNCIDFLSEWHRTLEELGLVGRWPAVLDGAANVLAESVIWGTITPAAAFERVFFLGVWPVMERLVSDLMRYTMLVSYPSAA
jgi:hypothetical protein